MAQSTLRRRFRGYDRDETDRLLTEIATRADALRTQRDALQEALEELRHEQREVEQRAEQDVNEILQELTASEQRVSELEEETSDLKRESARRQEEIQRLGDELLQARVAEQKHYDESREQQASLARLELRERVLVEQLLILKNELQQSAQELATLPRGDHAVTSRLLRLDRLVESVTREARHEAEVTLKKARAQAQRIVQSAEKSGVAENSSDDLQRHLGEALAPPQTATDESLRQ